MTDSEIKKKIEQYIEGELSEKEVDELWMIFFKNPKWLDYYESRKQNNLIYILKITDLTLYKVKF